MRLCTVCAILLAACGSSSTKSASGKTLPLTKVVFRQYYPGSPIFILESLSGRDIVKLRSTPARHRDVKPAYVPDDVMAKLLNEFKRLGFHEHSGARPSDPRKIGGRAELTLIGTGDRGQRLIEAFIRRDGQGKAAFETYRKCVETFRAVHAQYGKFQATRGAGEFGVTKAEFER